MGRDARQVGPAGRGRRRPRPAGRRTAAARTPCCATSTSGRGGSSPPTRREAHAHFARSIDDARAEGNPFAEGRARLAWGEQLRRLRRRADAREHLDIAIELFRRVGANSFTDRATAEARAAGGQVAGEVVAHRLLTPHELQIARLVVGGASTRDVAAKLFISPRTIEAHLSTIFRKLGVRNRGELTARALDDPVLQPS